MAQRLEAALRRPLGPAEPRVEPPPLRTGPAQPERVEPRVEPPPARPQAAGRPKDAPATEPPPAPAPAEAKPQRQPPIPAQSRSVFDSLEEEMANLLGRPTGKE